MIKFTALLSVLAVGALSVVACSSSGSSSGTSGIPAADAGKDSAVKADTGPREAAAPPVLCGPTKVDYANLKSGVPNSAAGAGSCTAADITAARAKLSSLKDINDLAALFTGSCGACAYTNIKDSVAENSAPWASFVIFRDAADKITGFIENTTAACIATKSKDATCAKAWSTFDVCKNVACTKCEDDTERTDCETAAYEADTGTCAEGATPDVQASCKAPTDLNKLVGTGGSCAGGASDKTNGDRWVTLVGAACGL